MTAIGEQVDEVVAGAFPPAFAAFGRTLLLQAPGASPATRDIVPLPELLRPETLARTMHAFAAPFPGGDRRAVLSFWSQHYLLALVPAAVTAALVSPQDPSLPFDGTGAVLSPDGRPVAFCLSGCARPAACSCPAARLTPLLRGHLEPLAAALAAAGLPPRVFWGNAAAVLAWTLDVVRAPADRVEAVARASRTPRWVDAAANPLAPGTRPGTGHRTTCCLRYRLAGVASCPDCPRGAARSRV